MSAPSARQAAERRCSATAHLAAAAGGRRGRWAGRSMWESVCRYCVCSQAAHAHTQSTPVAQERLAGLTVADERSGRGLPPNHSAHPSCSSHGCHRKACRGGPQGRTRAHGCHCCRRCSGRTWQRVGVGGGLAEALRAVGRWRAQGFWAADGCVFAFPETQIRAVRPSGALRAAERVTLPRFGCELDWRGLVDAWEWFGAGA